MTVNAFNDVVREGPHNSVITHEVLSTDADYDGLETARITVRIADNDTPGVLVTQTGGSTDVIESPASFTVGSGTVTGGTANTLQGDFAFTAGGTLDLNTFRFTRMQLLDPSGTIPLGPDAESSLAPGAGVTAIDESRYSIEEARWSMFHDPNIGDTSGNTSEQVPHATIAALGDGAHFDSYVFNVTRANSRGIFDIDFGEGGNVPFDATVTLVDAAGNVLAYNDDSSPSNGQGGSSSGHDSYLEYRFSMPGTYRLEVRRYAFFLSTSVIPANATYRLNVSLENHPLTDFGFASPNITFTPGAFLSAFTAPVTGSDTPAVLQVEYQVADSAGTVFTRTFSLTGGGNQAPAPINVIDANTLPIDLRTMLLTVTRGAMSQSRTIVNQATGLLTVDSPWTFTPQAGDGFSITLPTTGREPYQDSYSVVLTSRPLADVTVVLKPSPTRTYNALQAFDASQNNGEHRNIQVIVEHLVNGVVVSSSVIMDASGTHYDGTVRLTFTQANWNVPQTVRVRAIDDAIVDGSSAKVFPNQPERLDGIRGPLTIEGGYGGRPDPILGDPVMLPYENNLRVPDGTLTAPAGTNTLTDANAPWVVSETFIVPTGTSTITHTFGRNLGINDHIQGLLIDGQPVDLSGLMPVLDAATDTATILLPMPLGGPDLTHTVTLSVVKDITDYGILILSGQAKGQTGVVASVSTDGHTVTLKAPWSVRPQQGDTYAYFPTNPNEVVVEDRQVDTLNIYNRDSVADDVGTLTSNRLTGLGMGPDTVIGGQTIAGGIGYNELEVLNLYLGSGNDHLTVESTHSGRTLIDAGAGRDVVNVRTIGGHTVVLGGPDIDLINAGSGVTTLASGTGNQARLIDEIGALLVIDGGDDRIRGQVTTVSTDGKVLSDLNADFPTDLPAANPVIDLSRLAVDIHTQANLGTLTLYRATGMISFLPNASFSDDDTFVFEYRLYDFLGNVGRYLVTLDAAALDADGNRANAYTIDAVASRSKYIDDLNGLTVEITDGTGDDLHPHDHRQHPRHDHPRPHGHPDRPEHLRDPRPGRLGRLDQRGRFERDGREHRHAHPDDLDRPRHADGRRGADDPGPCRPRKLRPHLDRLAGQQPGRGRSGGPPLDLPAHAGSPLRRARRLRPAGRPRRRHLHGDLRRHPRRPRLRPADLGGERPAQQPGDRQPDPDGGPPHRDPPRRFHRAGRR